MKFKTKGLTMAAVSVLAMGAMVSTGFATWVITGTSKGNANATISVDTKVQYVDIQMVNDPAPDLAIRFAPKVAYDSGWLHSTITDGEEDLVASVSFNVKGISGGTVSVSALNFAEEGVKIGDAEDQHPYAAAVTKGLVSTLPDSWSASSSNESGATYQSLIANNGSGDVYLKQGDTFTLSNATPSGTATITFKLKLDWGTAFGSDNPIDFYNSVSKESEQSVGLTYGEHALSMLTSTEFKNLNAAKFKLSFTLESVIS